jgi:hypothetical protein
VATTYFKAELPCALCGQTNTAWLESALDDQGKTYGIGDRYDDRISIADFAASGFMVRRPADGEPIHAVMSWTCPNCNGSNFGEVVLSEGIVKSIVAVELDAQTLERIHHLDELTEEMLQKIAAEPLRINGKVVPNWLARVRAGLAAGRRW